MLHLLLWRLYLPSHHLTVTENALIVVGCRLVHQTVCFWTPQQRAERLRENPGCTADSSPWLALDNPLNLPLALPPLYAPSPTHPFPPPPPRPTGPWGYHLWIHLCPHSPAWLSHRILHTQTVNDNSVRAFHIPYTQFPPPTIPTCDVTHSLLPLLPQSLHNHPPQSWMARLQLFSLLLLSVLWYFSLSLSRASWMCLLGLSYEHGLKLYIRTLKGFFFCLHLPSQEMQPQQPECLTWNTHKL